MHSPHLVGRAAQAVVLLAQAGLHLGGHGVARRLQRGRGGRVGGVEGAGSGARRGQAAVQHAAARQLHPLPALHQASRCRTPACSTPLPGSQAARRRTETWAARPPFWARRHRRRPAAPSPRPCLPGTRAAARRHWPAPPPAAGAAKQRAGVRASVGACRPLPPAPPPPHAGGGAWRALRLTTGVLRLCSAVCLVRREGRQADEARRAWAFIWSGWGAG